MKSEGKHITGSEKNHVNELRLPSFLLLIGQNQTLSV